jgi:hypothetical protein
MWRTMPGPSMSAIAAVPPGGMSMLARCLPSFADPFVPRGLPAQIERDSRFEN